LPQRAGGVRPARDFRGDLSASRADLDPQEGLRQHGEGDCSSGRAEHRD